MGEGNAAIQNGGGLPEVGDGGSPMTHTAGSVTTQSILLGLPVFQEFPNLNRNPRCRTNKSEE
jgi:hypothetical protein